MQRILTLLLGSVLIVAMAYPVFADRCSRELRRLEGWTIVSVTQVDGKFEGCDFDKVIKLMDGTAYRCSTYSYSYSYMPDAIVFAKRTTLADKAFVMIKILIDGELYDMSSVPAMSRE